MSNDTHSHGAHHAEEGHHGSLRDYVIGFVLSVILTAIPFWLVMARPIAIGPTMVIIVALAAVQMIVHVIYFLHMSGKAEGGWTVISMLFTIILVAIMLTGSLWVMYHLNTNMMPMPHDMSQMP
ncbi:cytochrome o ubiquinol oxidase subunit IV [Sphingobium sp. H39-3-25]|jgi:cytochrome o ubiquinol oxidase operon protein cyoD|uniref:cytochrome o ubiquinol oxidase subunit IV n=1 Tax=Sphingobium arseniciresistens TaxID=3030834 RepID=UPI0023B9105B|nr:cytochrome o ubiquinol oxidase subunit IV [Sphingobium arseniciresistens]